MGQNLEGEQNATLTATKSFSSFNSNAGRSGRWTVMVPDCGIAADQPLSPAPANRHFGSDNLSTRLALISSSNEPSGNCPDASSRGDSLSCRPQRAPSRTNAASLNCNPVLV